MFTTMFIKDENELTIAKLTFKKDICIPRIGETITLIDKGAYKVIDVQYTYFESVDNDTAYSVTLIVDYIEVSDN